MNVKVLRRLGAAFVFASVATSAVAETLGEHPAVIVAREWNTQGIDPNTFIVLHPAGTQLTTAAAPAEKENAATTQDGAPHAQ